MLITCMRAEMMVLTSSIKLNNIIKSFRGHLLLLFIAEFETNGILHEQL